jgi:hypothetical protein
LAIRKNGVTVATGMRGSNDTGGDPDSQVNANTWFTYRLLKYGPYIIVTQYAPNARNPGANNLNAASYGWMPVLAWEDMGALLTGGGLSYTGTGGADARNVTLSDAG